MKKSILFVLLLSFVNFTIAKEEPHPTLSKTVYLATAEREPYIGNRLPEQGYVAELVTEAFARSGYKVDISIYPLARAKLFAQQGIVDGLLPVSIDVDLEGNFAFSNSFPGDRVGLLKRSSSKISERYKEKNLIARLTKLKNYKFGVVRGDSIHPVFDQANFLHKQYVTNDLQNIEKLSRKRIDFAVIDRLTAASLMVQHRPDLIGKLTFLNEPIAKRALHIAFNKSNKRHQELLAAFNHGLEKMQADGSLNAILNKHGLFKRIPLLATQTVVNIATVNNNEMITLKKLSKHFEKENPNIKLNWHIMSENVLRERLLADIAIADNYYDVITIGAYEIPLWAKKKWLKPISHLNKAYDLDDLLPIVQSSIQFDEKVYALPFYAESSVTYYRKDLFKVAKISMPDNPSFDQITKLAKKNSSTQ